MIIYMSNPVEEVLEYLSDGEFHDFKELSKALGLSMGFLGRIIKLYYLLGLLEVNETVKMNENGREFLNLPVYDTCFLERDMQNFN